MALAERVEGAVIEDHAADDVDRAGLLDALFDIARGNFVVDGIVRLAEHRLLAHRDEQNVDDRQADRHGGEAIGIAHEARAAAGRPGLQFIQYGAFVVAVALFSFLARAVNGLLPCFAASVGQRLRLKRTNHIALHAAAAVFHPPEEARPGAGFVITLQSCHRAHLLLSRGFS